MSEPTAPGSSWDDLLVRLRPERSDAYLARGEDARADALLHRIVTAMPSRRRRSKPIIFTFTAITIVAGAGVTAAVLRSRSAEDPTTIVCYSTADPAAGVVTALTGESDRDAIELCGELWSNGTYSSGGPPPLVACVTDTEVVAVLPGPDRLCAQNGWDLAELAVGAAAHPATDLLGMLSDRFADQCFGRRAAIDQVESALAELELQGWTIDSVRAVDDGCNFTAVDVPTRTVAVFGLPE